MLVLWLINVYTAITTHQSCFVLPMLCTPLTIFGFVECRAATFALPHVLFCSDGTTLAFTLFTLLSCESPIALRECHFAVYAACAHCTPLSPRNPNTHTRSRSARCADEVQTRLHLFHPKSLLQSNGVPSSSRSSTHALQFPRLYGLSHCACVHHYLYFIIPHL